MHCLKPERFLPDFSAAIKCICSALWTEMTDFPTLSYISTRKIPENIYSPFGEGEAGGRIGYYREYSLMGTL